MPISSAFPFESRYVNVEDARIHYIEQGSGDPILFLHGNPTWSYLWRNIIPLVSAKGRCLAMDLVGFGKSEKAFRTPGVGWKMICEENVFVEQLVPGLIRRKLSKEEHDAYRMPFPTVESCKPIWRMPNMLPFSDQQDENYRAVKNIEDGLPTLTMPTLLL